MAGHGGLGVAGLDGLGAAAIGDADFARFDRDPNFVPTISELYNKYAVPPTASDSSTFAKNAATMDEFRDGLATSLAASWH